MGIVLMTIGFLGLVVILFTRYTIFGGLATCLSFLTYFVLFGTLNWLYLLLLFLGLTLLALEMIIPSFGSIGIIGFIMLSVGLYMSSDSPLDTLFNLCIAVLLAITVAIVLVKQGYQLRLGKGLVLVNQLNNEQGYQSFHVDYTQYLNQVGTTKTSLRPVGRLLINDDDIEVLSSGEMIAADETVIVYKVEGNHVYVRKI